MQKLFILASLILIIWASHTLTNYQMRNANTIDNDRIQRYVEYINVTNQLNSYERK